MVKRSQRLVALFAAIIILFEVAAVPQKAKAVALSASVIASVVAIMTACGVSYWASSQQDAIDYVGGKIDDYFASLEQVPESYEDWLGISGPSQLFEVISGGVMRFSSGVANKVLDFIRWFAVEDGIDSGGPVVSNANLLPYISGARNDGYYAGTLGSVSATVLDSSHIRFDFSGFRKSDSTGAKAVAYAVIDGCALGQYTASINQRSWSYPEVSVSSTNVLWSAFGSNVYSQEVAGQTAWNDADITFSLTEKYKYMSFTFKNGEKKGLSGYVVVEVSPAPFGTPATASVTPSSTVAIPEDLSENDSFDVSPSVSLSQGMSVDDASSEIFNGVTSTDGLTSTGEAVDSGGAVEPPSIDLSGILEALGSILNAILSIPSAIANGVQSIVSTIGQKVDSFKESFQGFVTSFDYYIHEIYQSVTEMAHDITTLISDRLEYLFVPDEVYVQNYIQSITHLFDGRVGILTFPLSVFVDFLTRFSSISDGDHSFHWGNINEPFSGKQVIAAGSYDLDDAVASSPMSTVYSIYLVVVKAIIAFWFLRLCQRKYELIVNGH